ncbi:MAG: DUF475 domain-containing protein [Gammaproteobacteria bacterium]
MTSFTHYYRGALIFTVVCLTLGVTYGWHSTGTASGTLSLLWIILVLSVLEVSLSFDNAVVNAAVLSGMEPVWQDRFLTWGVAFSVFGMRVVFPLAIVAVATELGPLDALTLSLNEPDTYQTLVSSAHISIAGFGGAFLCMVGMKFFFDAEKDVHWIAVVENLLSRLSAVKTIEIGLLLLLLWAISGWLEPEDALTFLVAGILGIVTYIAVEAINTWLQIREEKRRQIGAVVRSGLGGFLYLNVLDASFSFDGVIGAFALSNNMVIIALGLSIGAVFVRSMTIHLVRRGTLTAYRFLENGAFWAILVLGVIMLLSARFHIPEVITGLLGSVLIGLSLWWSIRQAGHNSAGS